MHIDCHPEFCAISRKIMTMPVSSERRMLLSAYLAGYEPHTAEARELARAAYVAAKGGVS